MKLRIVLREDGVAEVAQVLQTVMDIQVGNQPRERSQAQRRLPVTGIMSRSQSGLGLRREVKRGCAYVHWQRNPCRESRPLSVVHTVL